MSLRRTSTKKRQSAGAAAQTNAGKSGLNRLVVAEAKNPNRRKRRRRLAVVKTQHAIGALVGSAVGDALGAPFDPNVSILDLLFMTGPEALKNICRKGFDEHA